MQTVREVIERMLPDGTGGRKDRWSLVPIWPPDLFAVSATLVNLSGCYAHTRYLCGFGDCAFDADYRKDIERIGESYASGETEGALKKAWKTLASRDWLVQADDSKNAEWWDAAMRLMAIADAACAGIGFASEAPTPVTVFAFEAYLSRLNGESALLPFLPHSLCASVSPEIACVQPKTRTPQIGCTLRALSHNLALLPPLGDVKTHWRYAVTRSDDSSEPLNVLLLPFPFQIRGSAFASVVNPDEARDSPRPAFFELNQEWLEGIKAAEFAAVIHELISVGLAEVPRVHAVILPEGALQEDMARDVALQLRKEANIELFISGVASKDGDKPKNRTYSAIFNDRELVAEWTQSKHHRWKLDEQQIRRYHLGHVLGQRSAWWESIDVANRECHFYVFRHGASLAVLVCEDLARIDPVQNVVRAVGPNLVIALLMDGPQLERRWPGRYATVLADDPGSAVLTLTSVGLIRRSNMPSERGPRQIALWKEPLGTARELELPEGCHALLLTLSPDKEENITADGRSDDKMTTKLSLTSVIGIRMPKPPNWLRV